MKPDLDIAILGAGCAGLSLASALSIANVPGRIALFDPRISFDRDRTWCFWNTEEHPFVSAISHSWNSWRVSHAGRAATGQSRRYRYCHIAGDAFYRLACERVTRTEGQQLHQGVAVHAAEPRADGLIALETSRGRLLARQVFDGRPPLTAEKPAFLQRFVGWHVRTDDPCFDPETVDLMAFLPSRVAGRTPFFYLLPFSPTEALVEMTYLDDPALPAPDAEADLQTWLSEHTSGWEVLYTERGSLPMTAQYPDPSLPRNMHAIGARGGRIKASSGYAFLRIQRHSRLIAEALRTGAPVPRAGEPWPYARLDAVFLCALKRAPAAAPELFLRLFERAAPDRLVRFLSESSGPLEMLRVAATLPLLPMLQAALTLPGGAR